MLMYKVDGLWAVTRAVINLHNTDYASFNLTLGRICFVVRL